MSQLQQKIEEAIREAIPDAEVIVRDPRNDGQHFEAAVISEKFTGLPLVKQHRLVMQSVKELLGSDVHALGLKTFTPEKWAAAQG